jgi:hypothetical protein
MMEKTAQQTASQSVIFATYCDGQMKEKWMGGIRDMHTAFQWENLKGRDQCKWWDNITMDLM